MHHNFDDSDSGYDVEEQNKQSGAGGKSFGLGGYRGRIIFLGDGTEVLTDSAEDDDSHMFDNSEEDKDLISQVGGGEGEKKKEAEGGEKKEAAATEETKKPAVDEKKTEVISTTLPDKLSGDAAEELKEKSTKKEGET